MLALGSRICVSKFPFGQASAQIDQIGSDFRPHVADAVAAAANPAEYFLAASHVATTAGCIVVAGDDLLPIAGHFGKQSLGPLADSFVAVTQ